MINYNEIALQVDYKSGEYTCLTLDSKGYLEELNSLPMGSFLCMVGNLNVDTLKEKLIEITDEFVNKHKGKPMYSIEYKELDKFSKYLMQEMLELLHDDMLSLIIRNEIYNKIKDLSYISDTNTILFPNYIYLQELKTICINVINKEYNNLNSDDLYLLSGDNIKMSIDYGTNNEPEITYCIQHIGDLIAFDTSNYSKSNIMIKSCANCGKFFIPSSRSDEIYCDNIYAIDTGRTCKEIGYEQKIRKDLFKSAYRTAYKTQRARIKYNSHISGYEDKHFKPWNIAAKQALEDYQLKNDIDGFKEWLKLNKDNY